MYTDRKKQKEKELIETSFTRNNFEKDTDDESSQKYTIEDAVEHAGFGLFQLKLIFFTGVLSAANAMAMMLLSILGPVLQCEWFLSSEKKALISTIVFIGFFLGSFFWGMVSDKYGRKATFLIVNCLMAYAGLLTAFSTTFIWIILLRGIVGFGIGGGCSSFTLLAEFLPSFSRPKALTLYQIWWSFGSSFEVGMAYYILPRYGWRWFLEISSIPLLICIFLILFISESPRYLLCVGSVKESQEIIDSMLQTNGKSPMKGKLISSNNAKATFNVQNLFFAEYRCTLFSLLILWFGVTFCYYGIVLVNSEFFNMRQHCKKDNNTIHIDIFPNSTFSDTSCCPMLTDEDYKSMIISSFGEFFVIPINFFLIDWIGRKKVLALCSLLMSLFFMCLYICMSNIWSTMLIFGIRGLSSGLFNLAYIYTSEVFPTSVRSSAIGLCSSFGCIAAIVTPFVAQVFMSQNLIGGLIIYGSISFICFIAAICLPIETKGREMPQNFQEREIDHDDK